MGKHRLSLMPGHPKFAAAWNAPQEGAVWVRENLLAPGKKIASGLISNSVRNLVEQEMLSQKGMKTLIQKERLALLHALQKIPSPCNYQTYRKEHLHQLASSLLFTQQQLAIFAQELDRLLFKTLDPDRKALLIQSSVPFADTNWSLDRNDLHFVFLVNPGTGEVEMGQTDSKNQFFTPLPQSEWVVDQSWEIPFSNLLP